MKILQISTMDFAGGAERVAFNLFNSYRNQGHESLLAVGRKYSNDANVIEINNDLYRSAWIRYCMKLEPFLWRLPVSGKKKRKLKNILQNIAAPITFIQNKLGYENFNFPGIWRLLQNLQVKPDIIHCHNLHGDYFDLRVLSILSKQTPVVITMHDAWMLSGHCAHSFDCGLWQTGCGPCPDITIYPKISRDNSRANWERKKNIYRRSRLYISPPCNWLMQKVKQSILASAIADSRVIPYGIDISIFNDTGKMDAKKKLQLPEDAIVLLFAGNLLKQNRWKDYDTLYKALKIVAAQVYGKKIIFIALGTNSAGEQILPVELKGMEILLVPKIEDLNLLATYYQAADIYIHPALADTFPNVILEALACGTPVVATAICGIPEQVKSLDCPAKDGNVKGWQQNEATGILVPPKHPGAMSEAIITLIANQSLKNTLGKNAALYAKNNFDLKQQVNSYLEWYMEIIDKNKNSQPKAP